MLDDQKGIYLEWENDYNQYYAHYTGKGKKRKRSPKTPIQPGFDVNINISKRQEYCDVNGITFENYLLLDPTWKQTAAISSGIEFRIHFSYKNMQPKRESIVIDIKTLNEIANPTSINGENNSLPGSTIS